MSATGRSTLSNPRGGTQGSGVTRVGVDPRAQHDVLTFTVSDEEYGLGIEHIREISKFKPITEVPRVPGFVSGIILVRGQVVPVIDLRLRLRLSAVPPNSKSRILVVSRPSIESEQVPEDEREQFGLIVDRVNHVVRINEAEVEPPTVLAGHESEFVAGLSRIRLTEEETAPSNRPQRTGTGLAAVETYRIVILLDLLRVLSFEHAGSVRI
jgi:chemotaxis signal transduction protein